MATKAPNIIKVVNLKRFLPETILQTRPKHKKNWYNQINTEPSLARTDLIETEITEDSQKSVIIVNKDVLEIENPSQPETESCEKQIVASRKIRFRHCTHSSTELESLHEHLDETLVKVGDKFESRDSFRQYLNDNAKTWHYYYVCRNSKKKIIEYNCICMAYKNKEREVVIRKQKKRTTACPCKIRLTVDQAGQLVVYYVCNHHDHETTASAFHHYPHAKYLPQNVKEEFLDLTYLGLDVDLVQKYIHSVIGLTIKKKDIWSYTYRFKRKIFQRTISDERRKYINDLIISIRKNYGEPFDTPLEPSEHHDKVEAETEQRKSYSDHKSENTTDFTDPSVDLNINHELYELDTDTEIIIQYINDQGILCDERGAPITNSSAIMQFINNYPHCPPEIHMAEDFTQGTIFSELVDSIHEEVSPIDWETVQIKSAETVHDGQEDEAVIEVEQPETEAHVTEAYVTEAQVIEAHVTEAHVTEAHVTETHVTETHVSAAHVKEENMTGLHVIEAYVSEPHVSEAHVKEENMTEPHLIEAYVIEGHVTEAHVTEAYVTESQAAVVELAEMSDCKRLQRLSPTPETSPVYAEMGNFSRYYYVDHRYIPYEVNGGKHKTKHARKNNRASNGREDFAVPQDEYVKAPDFVYWPSSFRHCTGHDHLSLLTDPEAILPGAKFLTHAVFLTYINERANRWYFYYSLVESAKCPENYVYKCVYGRHRVSRNAYRAKGLRKRNKITTQCPCQIRLRRLESDPEYLTVLYSCNHHDHALDERQFKAQPHSRRLPQHIKEEVKDLLTLNVSADILRKYVTAETGVRVYGKYFHNVRVGMRGRGEVRQFTEERLKALTSKIRHLEATFGGAAKENPEETALQNEPRKRKIPLRDLCELSDKDDFAQEVYIVQTDRLPIEVARSRLETRLQNLPRQEFMLKVRKLQESVRSDEVNKQRYQLASVSGSSLERCKQGKRLH